MPKLSVDAFMAALTIASIAACSKAAPSPSATATAEPVASSTPSLAPSPAATAAASVAQEDDTSTRAAAVDAGIERKKIVAPATRPRASANAACGAGTCSDDMKK